MNLPRLLVIDDDEAMLAMIRDVAAGCGYEVMTTPAPLSAVAAVQQFDPAIILLDLAMPEGDGVKLMRRLAQAQCSARIAICSGASPKMLAAAFRLGREYGLEMAPTFSKPFEPGALRAFLFGVRAGLRHLSP